MSKWRILTNLLFNYTYHYTHFIYLFIFPFFRLIQKVFDKTLKKLSNVRKFPQAFFLWRYLFRLFIFFRRVREIVAYLLTSLDNQIDNVILYILFIFIRWKSEMNTMVFPFDLYIVYKASNRWCNVASATGEIPAAFYVRCTSLPKMITRLDDGRAKKLLPSQPPRRPSILDIWLSCCKNNSPVINIERWPF